MALYVGIDLHASNGLVALVDQEGKRVKKRRLKNDPDAYLSFLAPYREEIVGIAVESTFNWYWLVDLLMDAGYPVHLANPSAIQKYRGLKYSDDQHDAFWLAEMLRLGILPEGYIYPKEERPVRDLLRKRGQLVHHRTAFILSLQNTIARNGGGKLGAAKIKAKQTDHITPLLEQNEDLLLSGTVSKQTVDFLSTQIQSIEKKVLSRLSPRAGYEGLLTLPGVGRILALTILLETGEIGRFPTVGKYVSYCRKVPTSWTTNEKQKGKGNKKNGNKYLAWAFSEAAEFARRYDATCRSFFDRKMQKTNRMVAHQALAHKLARAAFFILRDQVTYDARKLFEGQCGRGGEPELGLVHQPKGLIGNRSGQ